MNAPPAVFKIIGRAGFTLIEMSIVLVIIGLIIGGVLVGRDLINAAAIRSQISQIEKYNAAVNTFRGKYGYLPGDMPDPYATQYGFIGPRDSPSFGCCAGKGDGNGILQGFRSSLGMINSFQYAGENVVFWVDLSTANLIDGGFNTALIQSSPVAPGGTNNPLFFPRAKIGGGNYIYVSSGGWSWGCAGVSDNINYYGISTNPIALSNAGLSVWQAQNIDLKIDDGMPQSGRVLAINVINGNSDSCWASGNGFGDHDAGGGPVVAGDGVTTPGTAITCYDNSASASGTPGVSGAAEHYSMEMSYGTGVNCELSFRFQ